MIPMARPRNQIINALMRRGQPQQELIIDEEAMGCDAVGYHPGARHIAYNMDMRHARRDVALGEDWDPDEDDDELGAEALADDDEDVEDALINGPGRLARKLGRLNKKQDKWEGRAATARTSWGRNRAERKADKFGKRIDRVEGKVAAKTGGKGMAGLGDFHFVHADSPAPAGHKTTIPLYPKALAGVYSGAVDQPVVKTVLAADGLAAELTLQTDEMPWQTVQIVGIQVSFSPQRDNGSKLYLKNATTKGGKNIFPSDGWQDADYYDIRNQRGLMGLRDNPIIESPNKFSMTVAVAGDNGDRLDFSAAAVVEIVQDTETPSGGGKRFKRRPASYATYGD